MFKAVNRVKPKKLHKCFRKNATNPKLLLLCVTKNWFSHYRCRDTYNVSNLHRIIEFARPSRSLAFVYCKGRVQKKRNLCKFTHLGGSGVGQITQKNKKKHAFKIHFRPF